MPSTVKANMRTCSKTTRVTAELQEDGVTVKIHIATDCDNVKNYAKLLGEYVTMDDCIDPHTSRIYDPDIRQPLSMPCLIPNAVMNAVYMELGMLSKTCARKAGCNDNEFVIEDKKN